MSELGFDIDEMDDDSSNVLKELRKAYKAKEKQVRELEEQLNEFQNASRRTTVEGVLAEAGIDSRVARFIPDSVTTADQVNEWLTDNGELFGLSVAKEEPEAVTAAARMASINEAAAPLQAGDMLSRIESATSQEELNQILFGNSAGPAL